MRTLTGRTGVSFAVDSVEPATELLPECRMHEAAKNRLGAIESCSDYHGTVVEHIYDQPLLAAVHTAFSEHRPLVLSPDAVWLTIAQGVAHHMAVHGERLRARFVAHQDALDLVFECRDWVEGTPENPWAEAFASWAEQIRTHVGARTHDALVCDFGTTGPVERAASQVVMMDVFERYFHYRLYCVCGIPTVTLEGTTADWHRLTEKVLGLRAFDLDWWVPHLLPICEQFVRASRGEVDRAHWQGICKLRSQYGGDVINGWVAKLFPYLRAFTNGPCNERNPIFKTGAGFQSLRAPSGLSRVPFTWQNAATGRTRHMEAVGGLLGVAQDRETLALRPKVGWAVREADQLDTLLVRLDKHTTFPGARIERGTYLPEDLCAFYHRTNGAELFGRGSAALLRIAAADAIVPLEWGEQPDDRDWGYGPEGRIWHRFASLVDGTWLALNLDRNTFDAPWRDDPVLQARRHELGSGQFTPICHGSDATRNRPGANPVVALSFTELLESVLTSGGKPAWLAPGFVGYGDAELFTRRK
jgi:hypothetical protein